MTFDNSLPHALPWNYPWLKDEIERRDEYIAQLEAELAHQRPQNDAHGAIDGESVKVPAESESGAHSEPDSREKLEFEMRQFIECNGWFGYPDEAEQYTDARKAVYEMFIGWLDRQAAITERNFRELEDDLTADNLWMHERIAELTAEREKLTAEHERIVQEMVDANTRQCERTNELTAERDEWKAKAEENSRGWAKANAGWAEANAALDKLMCADEIRRLS